MTADELCAAAVAFFDQFIERGASQELRTLRDSLASDPAMRARLVGLLPSSAPSVREGFDALRELIELEWERRGQPRDTGPPGLTDLLSWTAFGEWQDPDMTADPAQWHDWVSCVESVASGGGPS